MATHSNVLAWRISGTGGAWWPAIYGVAQSRTQLKWLSSSSSSSSLSFISPLLTQIFSTKFNHVYVQCFSFCLINLFLSANRLCFCEQAFSRCVEWGPLLVCSVWAASYSVFSYCGAQASVVLQPSSVCSVVAAHGLSCPETVESSWTRDGTCVPCIGRQILNHWTTTVLSPFYFDS